MIYYIVSYDTGSEDSRKREYVTSQAGINRADEIVEAAKQCADITIVNCSLTRSAQFFSAVTEKINESVSVYHPFIDKKNKTAGIIRDCIRYLNENLSTGDLVICYNAHYLTTMILCGISPKKHIKIIYQIEELYSSSGYYGKMKKALLRYCENLISKKCIACFAVNHNLINKHIEKKPHMISYGYLVRSSDVGFTSAKCDDVCEILYSGRLDVDGGVDIFLKSLEYVDFPCKVTVTGGGPLAELLKSFSTENPFVKFRYLGFVSQEELDRLMNDADIFVSPLRTDRPFSVYSFPSKVYQYLSFGGKVVSSGLNSLDDLCANFDNLFLYEENDAKAIFHAIKTAYQAPCEDRETNKIKFEKYFYSKRKELQEFLLQFVNWK